MAFKLVYVFTTILTLSAVLLCSTLCVAQEAANPLDTAEALKLKTLLEASRASTTQKPNSSSTAKTKINLAASEEDHDYNFHNDRLPALTEDEFNSLSHDANPLHFLKRLKAPETDTTIALLESNMPQADATKPQTQLIRPQVTDARH